MKNIVKLFVFCIVVSLALVSCENQSLVEDTNVEYYEAKTVSTVETTICEESECSTSAETEEQFTDTDKMTVDRVIYITPTGKKYHFSKACAGKNATEISFEEIKDLRDPCKKCAK